MEPVILRDSDEAQRFLLQGLWLQRNVPPVAATVKPILEWALEIAAGGQPLLPLGVIADFGHAAFGAERDARMPREPATIHGLPPALMRTYEDHVLGKVYADWSFERASDAMRRFQGATGRLAWRTSFGNSAIAAISAAWKCHLESCARCWTRSPRNCCTRLGVAGKRWADAGLDRTVRSDHCQLAAHGRGTGTGRCNRARTANGPRGHGPVRRAPAGFADRESARRRLAAAQGQAVGWPTGSADARLRRRHVPRRRLQRDFDQGERRKSAAFAARLYGARSQFAARSLRREVPARRAVLLFATRTSSCAAAACFCSAFTPTSSRRTTRTPTCRCSGSYWSWDSCSRRFASCRNGWERTRSSSSFC